MRITKMSDMVDYLKDAGFYVEKSYDSRNKIYIFRIAKNGVIDIGYFTYPEKEIASVRGQIMKQFCDDMIRKFDAEVSYIDTDICVTREVGAIMASMIKNVIFNDPATIVFWGDGTKTVVKAHDEMFDPEKGLAMAITKKFLGNKGNYFNTIKKWVGKYEEEMEAKQPVFEMKVTGFSEFGTNIAQATEAIRRLTNSLKPRWKIYLTLYDPLGHVTGYRVYSRDYSKKSSAVRRARQLWDHNPLVKWEVATEKREGLGVWEGEEK